MSIPELVDAIKKEIPKDSIERRKILTAIGSLQEGINTSANFYLTSAGYTMISPHIWQLNQK